MKNITFSLLLAGTTLGVYAQNAIKDSVEMGANYTNEIYYRLSDGTKLANAATGWHIGFSTSSNSSTIISNAGASMKVSKHPGTNLDFESVVDTVGLYTWQALYDDSLNFDNGAFSRTATGHPDYGWGTYSMATHVITGNSLFIVKIGTEYYKVDFIKKQLGAITFRYAKINETTGTTVTINASTEYATKDLVFFNLITGEVVDGELENWDLWAVKYYDLYNNMAADQAVTGILTNPKWKVARVAIGSTTQEDHHSFSEGEFSTDKNELGQSYKYMTTSYQWAVKSDIVYYLQNTAGDVWKWYPVSFVGTGAGKTVFMKEKMATAGLESTKLQFVDIYPNPSTNAITVVFDSKGNSVDIIVRNQMGQVVHQQTSNTNSGVTQQKIDISTLTNGMYFVEVSQNGNSMVQSLIKK